MRITLLFLTTFISAIVLHGQETLINNVYNRDTESLNGHWKYIIDPYETGFYDYRYQPYDKNENPYGGFFLDRSQKSKEERIEYDFDKSGTLIVPREWNTQEEKLFFYEGTIWYRKKFKYQKKSGNNRIFLYFGAANYQANVYLNDKKIGVHTGGFTPFNFEITHLLKKENSLVVKVDNKRTREAVPTLNTDWFNYGGLTRDVKLVEVPKTFVRDYMIQLKKGASSQISGFIQLDGQSSQQIVKLKIPELKINTDLTTNVNGKVKIDLNVRRLKHWYPENPKLYEIIITTQQDTIIDHIGFRSLETNGANILLNGQPIFLRGICIHEENCMRGGRAYSEEDARMLLNWVKELHCNFIRLAHYPHNEHIIRLADRMGIMVWEEIPVYWTILWDNENTFNNAKNQLTEIIQRDKNRASVIIWSMANETPVSPERNDFLEKLSQHARSLDNTRLISAALEKHTEEDAPLEQIVKDPFADHVDVVSFNEYIGWYDGLPEKCSKVDWKIKYDKPVIISEFGGGALYGFHGDKNTRWSEEFQEELYIRTIDMMRDIGKLRGVTPWILADFRSPKRLLPDIQDGWNRKGLISQNGNKKRAFYVLRKFYREIEKKYNK